MGEHTWYRRLSRDASRRTGKSSTFALACSVVLLWLLSGPLFGFSDTWQLAINTATTIVTFLMVFLIQNTQNRDAEAVQIKLDELIRATHGAHNALLDLEEQTDRQLDQLRERYEALARRAQALVREGKTVVSVLHEISLALQADEIVLLMDGRLVHHGPSAQAQTHRAIEAAFDRRLAIHALGPHWVALPVNPPACL